MKIDLTALKERFLKKDKSNAAPTAQGRRARRNATLRNAAIGILVFALCLGIGFWGPNLLLNGPGEGDPGAEDEVAEGIIEGERTNILVLGVDARAGETVSRADTIILASIDPELKRAAMVSIPRDTRTTINGDPDQKVSFGNAYGGIAMTVRLVEELMGEPVDYYVQLDFEGFEDIIDLLGGVTIDVEARKYKPSEGIDVDPGLQRLNGHDALGYVRYRDYSMGDIERTTVQQKFIQALKDEVLQTKTIAKIPGLVKQFYALAETNMTPADMLALSKWLSLFEGDTLTTQTLPGYFFDVRDENGTLLDSFWQTDPKVNRALMPQLMEGETVPMLLPVSEADALRIVPSEEADDAFEIDIPVLEGRETDAAATEPEDDPAPPPEDGDSDSEDESSAPAEPQPPVSEEIDIPVLEDDPPVETAPETVPPPITPHPGAGSGGPPADGGI